MGSELGGGPSSKGTTSRLRERRSQVPQILDGVLLSEHMPPSVPASVMVATAAAVVLE